ncbi:MAG TPA: glucose-6-phosphate dehydrogenase assembly protein OpcA [Candidatus Limnocylindrales bacterium]|nr:glucose-6-phosphate dehydrogenase assembly protein OpcA [Candidatus Limnocylindrales bacterium]
MAQDLKERSRFQSPEEGPAGRAEIRWTSRADSIAGIEQELARMWAQVDLSVPGGEEGGARLVSARTSVMNLVVITRRPEVAERAVATIQALTGRHPSRTLLITAADPDGPAWLDARVEAHCVLPREDSPEICAEMVILNAGGEAGRHLSALVTPLVVHDLPVTVWWPNEPLFRSQATLDLLAAADRLVVDGSSWNGDGLDRLRDLAELASTTGIAISDFALDRQSRWREAIASIFDDPDFMPYLRSIRRISVTYATHDETGAPGSTNVVKPVYHVAWIASCLGLRVVQALHAVSNPKRTGSKNQMSRGLAATLSDGRAELGVVVRPVTSPMPAGTTLRVELLAERRSSELRADVTAEQDIVRVRVWQDGVEALDRSFNAARRTDVDLLAQAIEASGRNRIAARALAAAADLVGPPDDAA